MTIHAAEATQTATTRATPACESCGATEDLDTVHDIGGDGSLSYYCHNIGGCGRRRAARKAAHAGTQVTA